MASHEARDVRLLDTKNFTGLGLSQAAFFDEAINLQGEVGFELLARGVSKAEVGKNIAAAFHKFYTDCRVLGEKKELESARLALISATKIVLKNPLDLMGIDAPEKM